METFEIFIIKPTGGTRGNSSKGTNFGEVGNPQNEMINLPSGISIETQVKFRSGSLCAYAVRQALIPNATLADIFHLFFNQGYEIHTNVDMSDANWVEDKKGNTIIPKGSMLLDEMVFNKHYFTGKYNMEFFPYMKNKFNIDPKEIYFILVPQLNYREPEFVQICYGDQGLNFRKKWYDDKYLLIEVTDSYPEGLSDLSPEEIWGA